MIRMSFFLSKIFKINNLAWNKPCNKTSLIEMWFISDCLKILMNSFSSKIHFGLKRCFEINLQEFYSEL